MSRTAKHKRRHYGGTQPGHHVMEWRNGKAYAEGNPRSHKRPSRVVGRARRLDRKAQERGKAWIEDATPPSKSLAFSDPLGGQHDGSRGGPEKPTVQVLDFREAGALAIVGPGSAFGSGQSCQEAAGENGSALLDGHRAQKIHLERFPFGRRLGILVLERELHLFDPVLEQRRTDTIYSNILAGVSRASARFGAAAAQATVAGRQAAKVLNQSLSMATLSSHTDLFAPGYPTLHTEKTASSLSISVRMFVPPPVLRAIVNLGMAGSFIMHQRNGVLWVGQRDGYAYLEPVQIRGATRAWASMSVPRIAMTHAVGPATDALKRWTMRCGFRTLPEEERRVVVEYDDGELECIWV